MFEEREEIGFINHWIDIKYGFEFFNRTTEKRLQEIFFSLVDSGITVENAVIFISEMTDITERENGL